jgi:hypothetical protein
MAYSKAKLKSSVIKHLLVLDHSGYENYQTNVRFEVFTAVTKKNVVFWDVTPCGSSKNHTM